MKLKELHPMAGRMVSYHGIDYRIAKVTLRRGRLVYIGVKPGEYLEYFINPTEIDDVL